MTNKEIDITRNRMLHLLDYRGTIAVECDDIVIRIPILNEAANRILGRLSNMELRQ